MTTLSPSLPQANLADMVVAHTEGFGQGSARLSARPDLRHVRLRQLGCVMTRPRLKEFCRTTIRKVSGVFGGSAGIKVRGVDATTMVAGVIDLQPFRDWAFVELEREAVGSMRGAPFFAAELAVPLCHRRGPHPAFCRPTLVDLGPEAILCGGSLSPQFIAGTRAVCRPSIDFRGSRDEWYAAAGALLRRAPLLTLPSASEGAKQTRLAITSERKIALRADVLKRHIGLVCMESQW